MQNLVIGDSSQLGKYFPSTIKKISSRNLNYNALTSCHWDTIYLCYAEQRTYLANDHTMEASFMDVNVDNVKETITKLQSVSNKIVYYSTAELWNNCTGSVSTDTPFSFVENYYTLSKAKITEELKNKNKYPNVSIAYPFNFNSVHRKNDYLFGKIFHSLLKNEPVEIGDTYYYRELLHPKMVVDASMNHIGQGKDFVIGSGRLVFVNDFIRSLFSGLGKDYIHLVNEKFTDFSTYRTKMFYSAESNKYCSINALFDITINELKQNITHERIT